MKLPQGISSFRRGRVVYMTGRRSGIYHVKSTTRTGLRIEIIALRHEASTSVTPHRELYTCAVLELEKLL